MIVGIGSFLCAIATPDLILNIVSYAVALVGVAFATWARQHAPWILDIHAVVPGLLAALIPMFRRSTRIEMSPTALNTFFPARAGGTPAMRT